MNTVNISNTAFHAFDGQESLFLASLDKFRSQPLSIASMQYLRKFSKEINTLSVLFNEGKNDIVNRFGEEAFDEAGNSLGKTLTGENSSEGMKAYYELCQLTNKVSIETIDLAREEAITGKPIIMSGKEYESMIFLFESMDSSGDDSDAQNE